MKKPEEDLEKTTRREFLRFLCIGALAGAAALTGINCTPAGQAHSSNWPRPKNFERAQERYYERHIDHDEPFNRHSEIYGLLRFDRSDIVSTYNLGGQRVARLRKGCGNPNHASNCITASIHGLHSSIDRAVRVTVADRTLHYVLEGDDRSFLEIRYDAGTGIGSSVRGEWRGPQLRINTYMLSDGRVANPVPRDGHGGWEIPIRTWHHGAQYTGWDTIIDMHNFLNSVFGESIFTDEDYAEAEYFCRGGAQRLAARIRAINTNTRVRNERGQDEYRQDYLLPRSEELLAHARTYRRISDRVAGIRESRGSIERRSAVNEALREMYNPLLEEYRNSSWQTDPNTRLSRNQVENRAGQANQIMRNLENARDYIGISN